MRVVADPQEAHLGYLERLEAAGARLVEADNPVLLAKAAKNATEVEGAVDAQRRDGAAMVRFLAWLDSQPLGSVDELEAADRLTGERAKDPLFQGESFPTISAHGPNAALPHYRSVPETNRPLSTDTVYLVDSGGQYLDATTDITRTVALGDPLAEVRERFTLVLKGHIAIATVVFPMGSTGAQLDTLARLALWQHGLDFDHGTGHGIGSYLCVHEGPQRISKAGGGVALRPGMIVSNEPGYYKAGAYGIRIENLRRRRAAGRSRQAASALFWAFATSRSARSTTASSTKALLTAGELAWLNAYHARVHDQLAPLLTGAAASWLTQACLPI